MLRLLMLYPMPLSQSIRASLERVTQISVVLVLNRLAGLLIPDIRSDLPFVQAHSTDVIPTGPKPMPSKVLLQTAVLLKQSHGTLAFDVPHTGGYRILRRNRKTHVDMVRA
jgi:hypothetical protein